MIPTKVTPAQFDEMVQRANEVLCSATPEQVERGRNWYRTAHDLALIVGDGDVKKGAGVIAALSANKSWDLNVKLAHRAATGVFSGHTAVNLRKAEMIMNGTDPADVLPMDKKTGNFYLCIMDPMHPTAVCIDRHAHDIAVGERYGNRDRGLSCGSRYATLADVYRALAKCAELAPPTVQAITWVTWLDRRDARM